MSPTDVRELLPRLAALRPLLRGARVVEVGSPFGAASADALLEAGAAEVLDEDELGRGPHDLVWVHEGQRLRRRLLDRLEGRVVVTLPAWGTDLFGAPGQRDDGAYEALVEALVDSFPSVEVAIQSTLVGATISFSQVGPTPFTADPSYDPTPAPSAYLFVCGDAPSGLRGQHVVPLPPAAVLRAKAATSQAARGPSDEWGRKVRDAQEREEAARGRAREAEARVRELERRFERTQADRADLSVELRRERQRAAQAQRNAEGVFDAVAERDLLLEEWKRRALDAERRLAELEARISRDRSLGGFRGR